MKLSAALITITGCGRLAFDPSTAGDGAVTTVDASPVCGATTLPASLTITGETFRYTSFMNARATLDMVGVRAVRPDGAIDGAVVSDAAGAYTLTFTPVETTYMLGYNRTSYEETQIFFDTPFSSDFTGAYQTIWTPGDGPLWATGATNNVYANAGLARDAQRGTVNIAIRDCSGAPLSGVQVALDPPAEQLSYQASDGTPSMTLTQTVGPYAHVIALNVPAGSVHVTATAPGLRFTDIVVVAAAQTSTIAILHGSP